MERIVKTLENNKKLFEVTSGYKENITNIIFEEMGELIQAISKMNRANIQLEELTKQVIWEFNIDEKLKKSNKKEEIEKKISEKLEPNLSEEMADVIICLCWITIKYKVQEDDVLKWLNKKCERMTERLEEGDFY